MKRKAKGSALLSDRRGPEISERKLALEEASRMATVVRDSNDAITVQDFEGQITAWNRGAELMYGYSEAEALTMNIELLTAPGKVDEQKGFVRRLVAGEAVTSLETQRLTKDGRVLDVWMTVTELVDETGQPIGIASTERDITERVVREKQQGLAMQVLAALNRTNDVVLLVQDILHLVKESTGLEAVGIRLRDGDDFPYVETNGFPGHFVEAERHLCAQTPTGELIRDDAGNPVLECMCGNVLRGRTDPAKPFFTEGGSFWSNNTSELLASTTEKDRQSRTRDRCNAEGYESVALIPLHSGEDVIGLLQLNDHRKNMFTLDMIQFFEDMGAGIGIAVARKRAADELQAAAKFPAENRSPVLRIAKDGTLLYANAAALSQLADWRPQVGQPAPAVLRDAACQALDRGSGESIDVTYGKRIYSFSLAFIANAGYANLYGRDVTDHLLLESQLRQAQKMESVGRLAGGVAHDFNNLLMGTMNYVELCRDGLEPDHPIREWLDEITADSQRAANLTRQLLAFARKQTIAPKVLDVNDAISNMLKLLRRLIGEDIDLAWLPGPGLGTVKMDPSQIDQVLANLCVNARDAIDGVGKLTIESENAALDAEYCASHAEFVPGDYVVLSVSDDGCGMDAETREHIFEPFFTTKGVGEGTGLGLATVYGIVKQNNGFINVYSEPGKGTTFKIYLPRFRGETVGEADTAAPAPLPGGNETILLVEDEKSIRVTAALFLEAFGYAVLAADCPEQALRLAAEHLGRIHLLITDVVMPGMSGRDLAAQLATDRPQMKRLFMSGYTADVIAHRGVLDEGVEFLGKPFSRDELAHKVREVLDRE